MNRIYRIVWNATINRWVVASEMAKGKKKRSGEGERTSRNAAVMFAATMMVAGGALMPQPAQAFFFVKCNLSWGPCRPPASSKPAPAPTPATGFDWNDANHKYVRVRSQATPANAASVDAVAIGGASYAGYAALGVGFKANATAGWSTALGSFSRASGANATAVGNGASATGKHGLALGNTSDASATGTVSVGAHAQSSADSALAVGASAEAQSNGAAALGAGARVLKSAEGAVALGANSVADRANTVSVGDQLEGKRQVVNVGAGTQGFDAVNVNQLRGVAEAFGGGAGLDADGNVVKPNYVVNGGSYNNVGDALAAAGGAAADPLDVHYDDEAKGRVSLAGANGTRVGNLQAGVVDADAVNVSQLKSAGFALDDAGAVRNAAVTYQAGSIAAGNPRVLLDPGLGNSRYFVDGDRAKGLLPKGTIISNVGDGIQDTDAANIGLVKSISQQLIMSRLTTNDEAGPVQERSLRTTRQLEERRPPMATTEGAVETAKLNIASDGLEASPGERVSISAAPSNGSGIDSGLERRINTYENGNWYLQANGRGDGVGRTAPSDTSQVGRTPGAIAIGADATTRAENGAALGVQALVTADARDAVALGAGSVATEANTLSVGSLGRPEDVIQSFDTQGNRITLNNQANTRRIVNMAAGRNDNDAVNVAQLKGVTDSLGGGAGVQPDGTVKGPGYEVGGNVYSNVGDALKAVADGAGGASPLAVNYSGPDKSKVALEGAGGTTLGNVKAAAADTDAVNLKQLKDAGLNVDGNGAVTNGFVAYDGAAKDKVTLAGQGGTTISNVKAGTADLDAVNVKQFKDAGLVDNGGNVQKAVLFNADGATGNANADGKQLANLAAGSRETDAVNLKQLKDAGLAVDGGGTVTNAFVAYDDGSKDKVSLAGPAGTTIGNVKAGVASTDAVNVGQLQSAGVIDDKGNVRKAVLFDGPSGEANVAGQRIINVKAGTADTDGANIKQLKDAGLQVDPTTGNVSNSFVAYDTSDKGKVTLRGPGGTTLANVKAATANDHAVNLAQLKEAGIAVDPTTGKVTNAAVIYDDASKEVVTLGGGAEGTTLRNVRAGVALTDGANVSQIRGLTETLGGGAGVGAQGEIIKPTYTLDGNPFNNVGDALTDLDRRTGENTKAITDLAGGSGVKYFRAKSAAEDAIATGTDSVAVGPLSTASGDNAIAAGTSAQALADNTVAAGFSAEASGAGAAAVGASAVASKAQAVAVGASSSATGLRSVAVGPDAIASVDNAASLGANASATAGSALALGSGARAAHANAVALGADSITARPDSVSVGGPTKTRQITYVGAGTSDTDAVNLKQLKDAGLAVDENGNVSNSFVAYDGPAKDKVTLAGQGGTTISNVKAGTADLDAVNVKQFKDAGLVDNGGNVQKAVLFNADGATGNANADGKQLANLAAGSRDTDAVNLKQLKDAGFVVDEGGNVSGSFVAYDGAAKDKVTLAGQGGTTISNVKAGTADLDAVNVKQFKDAGLVDDAGGIQKAVLFNGPNADANTAGKKLVNLSAGTSDNDGVNLKQLKDAGFAFDAAGGVLNKGITYAPGSVAAGVPRVDLEPGVGNSRYFADIDGDGRGDRGNPLPKGTRITNVADAEQDTDAANLGQVKSISQELIGGMGGLAINQVRSARSVAALRPAQEDRTVPMGSEVDSTGRGRVNALKQGNWYLQVNGRGDGEGSTPPTDTAALGATPGGIAIGSDSLSRGENAIALGTLAQVAVRDAVALGAGSVADQENTVSVGSAKDNSFETWANDGLSKTTLTAKANTRRIVNMAAGQGDTDAVNVGQLRQVTQALGGDAAVNSDGSVKAPSYSVGGNTYSSVGDALKAIEATTATGSPLGITYDDAGKGKVSFGGADGTTLSNVKAGTADTDAVNVSQLKASGLVDADGNAVAAVTYDDAGKTAITLGGKDAQAPVRLRNVADAEADSDAVNLKQLKSAGLVDGNGGTLDAVVYDSGSSKGKVTFAGAMGTVLTNVADGRIAAGSRDAVNGGQMASLRDDMQGQINGLGGRVTTLEGKPAGVAADNPYVDTKGPGASASAGGNPGNVAIGAGSQTAAPDSVAVGSGAKVTAEAPNSVALGKGSVADTPNSVSVGAPGSERTITNVAAGTRDGDAVNARQMRDTLQSSKDYTDSRINDTWGTVRREMNDMNRQVNRGIAASAALINVTPYLPGRTAINAGVASYRGETALGVGLSRWSDNGRFNINAGISAAREDQPVYRVGVGYVF